MLSVAVGVLSAVVLLPLLAFLVLQFLAWLKIRHLYMPLTLPVLGSACSPDLIARPIRYFRDVAMGSKTGVSGFLLGARAFVMVTDPDTCRQILKHHLRFYKARDLYQKLEPAFGKGLVTADGPGWKKQHDVVIPFFQPTNRVKHVPRINEIVKSYAFTKFDKWIGAKESRDVAHDIEGLLLNIFCDVAFNFDFTKHQEIEYQVLTCLFRLSTNVTRAMMGDFVPFWESIRPVLGIKDWFKEDVDVLLAGCDRIIDERLAIRAKEGKDPHDDVLKLLLDADIPRQQVLNEVCTMLGAGHDTTAALTMFTLMLLSKNPDVEAKLLAEYDQVLGDRDTVTIDDIKAMTYLDQVLNESMRMFPPVPCIGREALVDEEINGIKIPAKTTILINPITLNYLPNIFPEPTKFKPERWSKENVKSIPRGAFLPFGGGQRECIGRYFAIMEASIVLPLLMRRYKFVFDPAKKWNPHISISYRALGGLHFWVQKRE